MTLANGPQASPVWALNHILAPTVLLGLKEGTIVRPPAWEKDADLVDSMKLLFGFHIVAVRNQEKLKLVELGSKLQMPTPQVLSLFGAVRDWRWLTDSLRFAQSNRGVLGLEESVLVLVGEPNLHSGANIFGVSSRSMPACVLRALAEQGMAPAYNPPANSTATDCSVWLVEVNPNWCMVWRVEPLPERTWFDPASYDEEQRPFAEAALRAEHGVYTTSSARVIDEEIVTRLVDAMKRHGVDPAGLSIESGCLQHGPKGKETSFVGSHLEALQAIHSHGFRPFLDLQRGKAGGDIARGGSTCGPWTGKVAIGGKDCSFLLDNDEVRNSGEMAWAAQMRLNSEDGPERLRGIFRQVRDNAVRMACDDPERVRYVVSQALVGKHGAPKEKRVKVGFLVREEQGGVSSGWSILGEDIHDEVVQYKAIAQAEKHLQRMGPRGPVLSKVKRARAAGIQTTGVRKLTQIQARHGAIIGADILNTRASQYL